MNDEMKTKEQLIAELIAIGKRVAEMEVLKNDETFRYFVENANDIVYSLTPDGVFVYVSPNWTEILGHDIHKVVGQPMEAFVHPEDIPFCRAFMERVIATGKKQGGIEYRVRHENGAWRWHASNAAPVRDAGGNIISYMGIARDITDRKLAEEALHESEKQYRLVVENAGEAISIAQDGMHKFVNRRALEILGYSQEEIISRPFIELVHPDDREMVLERYSKRLKNEDAPNVYPLRIISKDGTVKSIEIHPILVSWNNKPATLNFFIDVTERKRVEEALMASERTYQTIFENTGTTMLIVEEDMTISLANDGFESLTGYKREEMGTKRKWTEFVEKEDLEKMVAQHQLRRADPGRTKKSYEFRLVHKDGSLKNILLTVDLIPETKRSVASLIDITDRKRAEEALKEQLDFLQVLIDTIPIPVFFKDTKGIYIGCNVACETFFGPRDQLLGKTVYEVSPQDIADVYYRADLELLNNPGIQIYETIVTDKTGARRNAIINKATYNDKNGNLAGLIGIIFDITERKQMEERLNRAEKMESLGRMAGGVAHDLNNVLGVLVGYSELLLKNLPEDNPLRRYADNILQSSMRGAAIIQDLLNLARRGVAVSEVVDINKLIVDYLKTPEFENMKSYHPNVKIRHELEGGLLNIKGSPVHLSKVLINLVSNSAEAIADEGEVTISTENRYLDQPIRGYDDLQEGDYVVLTVSDTGKGISSQDIGKIFEPFYTKKVMGRSGTGLGLAVVWGTVKDHNGYIDVQSEEGKGTVFALYFPVTREDLTKANEAPSPSIYMGRGESILVVDDRKEQRELAANILGWLGYQVKALSGGEEAVAYLKDNKADLVVLDMIMAPGIDGLETYRRILAIKPDQKAIIVSGFSETDRVKEALEIGAGSFVMKPYILEKIGLAVRRELDRSNNNLT